MVLVGKIILLIHYCLAVIDPEWGGFVPRAIQMAQSSGVAKLSRAAFFLKKNFLTHILFT